MPNIFRLASKLSASSTSALAVCAWVLLIFLSTSPGVLSAQSTANGFRNTTNKVQSAMVKIVGSGGFQGLEPYQSGFLVSSSGHVLTVWSYVLDSDVVTVTLDDGQRYEATLLGYDPKIEVAVLKIKADGLSNFNLDEAVPASIGNKILAFSNLYGVDSGNESNSVQLAMSPTASSLESSRPRRNCRPAVVLFNPCIKAMSTFSMRSPTIPGQPAARSPIEKDAWSA